MCSATRSTPERSVRSFAGNRPDRLAEVSRRPFSGTEIMSLGGKRLSRAASRTTIRRNTAVSKNSGLSSVAPSSRSFELRRGIHVPSSSDDVAGVHFFSRTPEQVPLWEHPDPETALFQSRFESSVPVVELQNNRAELSEGCGGGLLDHGIFTSFAVDLDDGVVDLMRFHDLV